MTKPESLPVEEARKKFADILDGTQFRRAHTEITRRGKAAGVVVPPEWYDEAVEALTEKRRKAAGSPPPAAVTPRQQVTEMLPKPVPSISPKVLALPLDRVVWLVDKAETVSPEWVEEIRQEYPHLQGPDLDYLIVDLGHQKGFKIPELDEPSAANGEPTDEERPVGGEENTG
ncbi:type II toxin-antitoxin system Phd/YefM family antitoxin [Streptomyces bobili]|uniref:type II toxin-antitoxin system Phd/YefM family antitoxin n=1 Tax=Streptomyces bobili TaxID=67280 RepID=UPI0033D5D014